jgi:hypothetical protein
MITKKLQLKKNNIKNGNIKNNNMKNNNIEKNFFKHTFSVIFLCCLFFYKFLYYHFYVIFFSAVIFVLHLFSFFLISPILSFSRERETVGNYLQKSFLQGQKTRAEHHLNWQKHFLWAPSIWKNLRVKKFTWKQYNIAIGVIFPLRPQGCGISVHAWMLLHEYFRWAYGTSALGRIFSLETRASAFARKFAPGQWSLCSWKYIYLH